MTKEDCKTMISLEKKHINLSIGVAVTILIAMLVAIFQAGVYIEQQHSFNKDITSRVDHLSEKYVTMREDIDLMDEKANSRDIQLTEIKVKLTNIELLLVEIKQDIKGK